MGFSTPSRTSVSSHGEAADAGHAHVKHDGTDAGTVKLAHEGFGRGPGLHAQADRADEQRDRVGKQIGRASCRERVLASV